MVTKYIINPYYCYILSFGLALFIYSWQWSNIYPEITFEIIVFLAFSFTLSYFIGKKISSKIQYQVIPESNLNKEIITFIILGYCVEFLYNGGIPLYMIVRGSDVSYMDFGIPVFHVFLHTVTGFYTVYLFHQYISSRSNEIAIFVLILFLPNILIINRGALIITITACLIIYLISIRKISTSRIVVIALSAMLLFYGFGYLGNLRSFNGDPQAFLKLTKASENFLDSSIPKEYYWFYIYASSPFANFQNVTLTSNEHNYNFLSFVSWELLPDFLSKRILPIDLDVDVRNRLDFSVNPLLTVGSMYFDSYIRMGWYGPIFLFLYYVTIMYLYIANFRRNSVYFLSSMAILCVVAIFSIFENMINFSGLSFQLIYPLVFSKIESFNLSINLYTTKIRFNLRK